MNLTCSYSEPASITWFKDGAVVSSSFQVDQSSPSSSQLVIPSVQHTTHAGQYHCVANTTSAGQVDTSVPFTITVHCEWTTILTLFCIYIIFFQPTPLFRSIRKSQHLDSRRNQFRLSCCCWINGHISMYAS